MHNREITRAWEYHNRTKHSYESVRRDRHFLDWANQPLPFKIYKGLEPLPLPEREHTGVPALRAIAASELTRERAVPSLPDLAHLLQFSAGITRRKRYPGGQILFRAASCTGALYEIELYLVCADLPELEAGVYHFGPADRALRRLRAGDYRGTLLSATGGEASVVHAPAILASTGTYWRNAWKYRARTYRHFGWDNGTIHANLLAVAAALDLPHRIVCGFADAEVNRLLGLDTDREVSLTLVALGRQDSAPPAAPELALLQLETEPLSRKEMDYALMREMHAASSLASGEEAAAFRAHPAEPQGPLPLLRDEGLPPSSIEEVILRRGSTRRFLREPITAAQLSTILDRSTQGIPADFLATGASLNELYVVVHAVEGVEPGAYNYRAGALELLKSGNFRSQTARLALDQDLAGDASATVFFLGDLNQCLERFGNRGYRAVQLEAGILGGKIYLAAYAQRLGATGLTFYDDDVVEFFSPHARGKSAIFAVAVGRGTRPPG